MLLPLLLVVAGAVGGQDTGGPYTGTIAVHTGADTQVLYCTVLYCTVLYCTVLYCTVLFCVNIGTAGRPSWTRRLQTPGDRWPGARAGHPSCVIQVSGKYGNSSNE